LPVALWEMPASHSDRRARAALGEAGRGAAAMAEARFCATARASFAAARFAGFLMMQELSHLGGSFHPVLRQL
jgi:hypothetical protein